MGRTADSDDAAAAAVAAGGFHSLGMSRLSLSTPVAGYGQEVRARVRDRVWVRGMVRGRG